MAQRCQPERLNSTPRTHNVERTKWTPKLFHTYSQINEYLNSLTPDLLKLSPKYGILSPSVRSLQPAGVGASLSQEVVTQKAQVSRCYDVTQQHRLDKVTYLEVNQNAGHLLLQKQNKNSTQTSGKSSDSFFQNHSQA